MRNISKRFGAVVASDRVNFRAAPGEIHALVGENGAGKSTLMKILCGLYAADEGEVFIAGKKAELRTPRMAIAMGIGMVHQQFMLVPTLTVLENVILGTEPTSAGMIDYGSARRAAASLCERVSLTADLNTGVQHLPVGVQQRVEILKVLFRGAKVLIMDEPTDVLSPIEIEDLFSTFRSFKSEGKSVIFITHKLNEVMAVSDRVTVMRDGTAVGTMETDRTNPAELARMMVGRDVTWHLEKTPARHGDEVLEVKDLHLDTPEGAALRGVSFSLRAGEILGVAGIEGNGQTELVEVITGLRRPSRGRVLYKGRDITGLPPRAIRERAIAHVPEDRDRRGFVPAYSVAENLILGSHYRPPYTRGPFLNLGRISRSGRQLMDEYDIRPRDEHLPARNLSGGNRQKLILAREFSARPDLVIAAQPTRGMDIATTEFIHQKLLSLRDTGKAVLLVSADLEEMLALSDRVVVMFEGRIVKVVPPDVSRHEIALLMAGVVDGTDESEG